MHTKTLVLFLATVSVSLSNDAAPKKSQLQKWHAFYMTEANAHEMVIGKSPKRRSLTLHDKPLLSYVHAASGSDMHGQFFAWMDNGRPAVIATIWSSIQGDRRKIVHSMHTLSSEPIRDVLHEDLFWTPRAGQVIAKPLKHAGRPSKSKGVRLAQMRKLAKEFKGTEMKRRADGDTVPHALRLQPQPLVRYESLENGIVDGGLFAMFIGWDPDLVLQLEAAKTERGELEWRYSMVPFTPAQMNITRKGQEWEIDVDMNSSMSNAYYSVHGTSYQPVTLD